MQLGAFSISLAVKDLQASMEFYKKFGFTVFGGDSKNWAILKNGDHLIGFFQGMFEKNILTLIRVGIRTPQTLMYSPTCAIYKSN